MKYFLLIWLLVLPLVGVADIFNEAYYNAHWCDLNGGITEHVLPDRTRVDCLTDDYAVEADYGKKWAESIGQSLYYSKMTNRPPAVLLLVKMGEERFIERFRQASEGLGITLFLRYVE